MKHIRCRALSRLNIMDIGTTVSFGFRATHENLLSTNFFGIGCRTEARRAVSRRHPLPLEGSRVSTALRSRRLSNDWGDSRSRRRRWHTRLLARCLIVDCSNQEPTRTLCPGSCGAKVIPAAIFRFFRSNATAARRARCRGDRRRRRRARNFRL